jgi:hydrophobe/amphiphile efflux-1 (HAE1) family protein/NodT family efflux transporter outer membrane factor (OMF) lipoprotein
MNFSFFFIKRPVFAGVLSFVVLLIGLIAMRGLPISEYPEVVPPTVIVHAVYPGANPRTISETVAAPLEQAINGVENSLYMSSQATSDGVMTLTVTFKLGTNADQAQVQVQNRVSQALPKLPEEVRRLGVTTLKSSPDLTMVVHLFSPDDRYDDVYVRNYAALQVKDVLARLPGVGQVQLFGSGDYAMRVWLDPDKIAARSLTASDVVAAIREQNVQVAAGGIGQPPLASPGEMQIQINAKGRLVDEEEFGNIVVKRGQNGEDVRLRHVARVELGASEYALRSLLDNKPAVAIPIFQLPGSNAIAVSDAVRGSMEELKRYFPAGLDYRIAYDPTVFVRDSIKAVVETLIEAILLVVIVVVLFLQTWRASIIPLAAVPVSLIGTFAVMSALGFGINALSLFGLVLAIGIVVDDAIVVVENVERNIALGLSPVDATRQAMKEVTGPIVATALVLGAVFIPTAFISGLTGQFYKQFAITIAISTAISAFNSLTLSPALSALLLREHGARKDWLARTMDRLFGWIFRPFNWAFARAAGLYGRSVTGVIRKAALALVVYVGLVFLAGLSFQKVPIGFVPTQDKQYLVAFAQLPDGASLDRTDAVIRRMSQIALDHPGVESSVAFPGLSINGFTASPNSGIVFVTLKPFEERRSRELSGLALAADLNAQFASIKDSIVAIFPPPPVQGLGTIGGFKLYVEDRADQGYDALYDATWQLIGKASQSPQLAGLFSTFQVNVPQLDADVDRAKAQAQGVPLGNVFDTMQVYLGSLYVNDFNRFGRTYQVVAQADEKFRDDARDIARLRTRNDKGQMVPLSSIVRVHEGHGPDRVMRYNGYPAAEINGAPGPGTSSGDAEQRMAAIAAETLPKNMKFEWTDLTYQKILAGNTAVFVFPLSILLVFLVLAAQYESFRLPLAVILIVPLTLLAAMAGVMIKGGDNNVFTQIGLIVLIGLAAKNAILIVEFAKAKQDEGLDPGRAAVEAAKLRLRPILMTSIAFVAGVSPLVTSRGAGSEMRQAMGVAVFSGMLGVTLFGLLLTPVFYTVLMRIGRRRATAGSRDTGARPVAPAVAHALLLVGAGALLLSACTVLGPDYERPEVGVPAAWRDVPQTSGAAVAWQQASPADQVPRGAWWRVFGDETLNGLEARAAAGNQDLKSALARIQEARAIVRAANADRLPSATLDPSFARTRYSPNAGLPLPVDVTNDIRVPLDASWELDLWGRVQRSVESAEHESEATIDAYEALRLVLHADVAIGFFTLRALDLEQQTLERTVQLRSQGLGLLQARLRAGNATDLDVARAEVELSSAQADRAAVARARSEVQSSLAVLVGEPASSFEIALPIAGSAEPPSVPPGLPGDLLERRPDVAGAERRLAASNARIGVAEAGFFPTVRLTGYAGVESKDVDGLFDLESNIWSIGPSLSLPIFQGGRNQANLRRSRAAFEESVAAYRQSVLVAFKEVQDALTATRLLAEQGAAIERTVEASRRASQLARTRFDAGYVGYIDVIDSQRTELVAERAAAQVAGLRFVATVQLIKSLGGGWNSRAPSSDVTP